MMLAVIGLVLLLEALGVSKRRLLLFSVAKRESEFDHTASFESADVHQSVYVINARKHNVRVERRASLLQLLILG